MHNVLIIDDDPILCERLRDYFRNHNLALSIAHTPREGQVKLESQSFDVLLLDVMLPETDGFTLCKQIRETSEIPIIMLTARGELSDKVLGLELGADDYLAKPFEPRELVARIQVIIRRNQSQENHVIDRNETWHFEGMTIEVQRHRVLINHLHVPLTGMEFRLLTLLAGSPGQVFNRDQVLNALRGTDADIYSRSIDILVSRLRQKIGDQPKDVKFIRTLRGAGYTFVARKL
ncbi:response regulator transcription factor [Alteromonas sp. KUL49]|uniref:response regulator transcription factor n=1 Tax=Alteromonas sp. KUL49 TaxID=2480798 RepID=UPI00102F29E7|nr:response regulator transcription factor [Alteromonas sp. KUL49]TAP39382.1 response regulator transcription factor [Alteromonas sp. KUL49]GEA12177.1 DNA-binding response regulator [Alteromonas sp. KUL49]